MRKEMSFETLPEDGKHGTEVTLSGSRDGYKPSEMLDH